jgi:hypothetical protein
MERTKQSKVVDVDKGLLLVRYATAENESRPPRVKVVVNPKHQKNIELLLSPDHSDPVLWQPGSCLVVRASRPGQLFVEVIPIDDEGSVAATVKIEPLSQGRVVTAIQQPSNSETEFNRVRLIGHVAGSGDVFAGADEWIAGPDAPTRIEGLSFGQTGATACRVGSHDGSRWLRRDTRTRNANCGCQHRTGWSRCARIPTGG